MEVASTTVHDDFLRMFKEAGLEKLATEVGILCNGEIPALKPSSSTPSGSKTPSLGQKRKLDTNNLNLEEDKKTGSEAKDDNNSEDGEQKGKKKRSSRKAFSCNKGLRHSSMKVMRKVEEKGKTTYNEVADELVEEYTANKGLKPVDQAYEGKNIRRRVYDILNVLIAMDIISREKKEIRWRGLPSNAERDLSMLHRERKALLRSIEEKHEHLQQLLLQQIALKNLIKRNKQIELKEVVEENQKIPLPFIVINTNKDTIVECELKMDQTDIFFNFNNTFEIHDDNEVLKRMKLQAAPPSDMTDYIPEALIKYLPENFQVSASKENSKSEAKTVNGVQNGPSGRNVPTILANVSESQK
mmetsp:Transcript_4897/g.5649  ORF Transcript_4897/g.5649 Transcript_4897/m.5649 type:complete len:357 (+) Transcript_4897:282-1352(+)|eukprot:CAMPEP_0184021504 /NCGR_PEP_ID=MMETSP0954-20121128/9975_1 /TAXON_ID=627963 /ORGANISM="Aplanochytrium sp, Strain PBS07" /LENGTH=356 /DNA_ID=CAMNT_0026303551 /DNA_START=263 /DNA_END=1333 /DNA_ORIENTATION=+